MFYTVMQEDYIRAAMGQGLISQAYWTQAMGIPVQLDGSGTLLRVHSTEPNVYLALQRLFPGGRFAGKT